jgi:hypothetical protein
MSEEQPQPIPDQYRYEVSVGGERVLLTRSNTFAYILNQATVIETDGGVQAVEKGDISLTYGAGPCLAGVLYNNSSWYLFHIGPTKLLLPKEGFLRTYPIFQSKDWGLIGGSVDSFKQKVGSDIFNNCIMSNVMPFNIALDRSEEHISILWGSSYPQT